MRIAVISDIHANLHALEAVLAAIDADGVDEIWCLGDLVGYGPRPNECVALVRERASLCLAGNHDLAVLGRLELEFFADEAGAAAAWTRTVLDADAATYLGSLDSSASVEGVTLAHGSPRDPIWEYVLSDAAADAAFAGRAGAADPRRAQPRCAGARLGRQRRRRRQGAAGNGDRTRRGQAPPQPGLGWPAAGRRPPRSLARD